MRLADIVEALGLHVEGDAAIAIEGLASLEDAGRTDLSFVTGSKYRRAFERSAAAACLVPQDFESAGRTVVRCAAPYAEFARAVALLYPRSRPAPGVHETAVIADDARIGQAVHIGAYSVIGRRVAIGDRSVIHPHVTLYDGVRIGADCEIHAGACLREDVELGDRIVIQNGAVLGAEGFGLTYTADGRRIRVPHVGGVVVGDDAQIGANTTIDASHPGHARRGDALARTRIGSSVAIDNLVQVGHGCAIGDHSTLCAQVALGGSTELGRLVTMAGAAKSAGHLRMGDGSVVAGMSGVSSDLEDGSRVAGVPHVELSVWLRMAKALPRVPELLRRVRRLEQRLAADDEATD